MPQILWRSYDQRRASNAVVRCVGEFDLNRLAKATTTVLIEEPWFAGTAQSTLQESQ